MIIDSLKHRDVNHQLEVVRLLNIYFDRICFSDVIEIVRGSNKKLALKLPNCLISHPNDQVFTDFLTLIGANTITETMES